MCVPVKYMHPFPGCPCEALDAKLDRQPVKGPFKGQFNDGVKDHKKDTGCHDRGKEDSTLLGYR